MRRKSERNKAKGTPEKKVERPTRKSTRRRARKSPSTSPEVEIEPVSSTPAEPVKVEEAPKCEKVAVAKIEVEPVNSSPEEDNNGSVWKVARADASPGEIQKLKLCRQRNISEASSDNSVERKKSNKWQESGGDGVVEEDDSAEEAVASSKETPAAKRPDEACSRRLTRASYEEVSDCREPQPETTSANLSDAIENADHEQQTNSEAEPAKPEPMADGELTVQTKLVETAQNDAQEEPSQPQVDQLTPVEPQVPQQVPEEVKDEVKEEVKEEIKEEVKEEVKQEPEQVKLVEEKQVEEEPKEVSEEEKSKAEEQSSESSEEEPEQRQERKVRSSIVTRRKHRDKYQDSSNSDSNDSEEEQEEKKVGKDEHRTDTGDGEDHKAGEQEMEILELQVQPEENDKEEEEEKNKCDERASPKKNERKDGAIEKVTTAPKPTKVYLKRSFKRFTDSAAKKENDTNLLAEPAENKENCEVEAKSAPKRRRWGTTITSDNTPAFSVSTETLKALVPEAKPLSLNEVRLTKDEDSENRKRERKHSLNNSYENQKNKDDRNTDAMDNYSSKRKISIVKDSPSDSPSPPSVKPTNILLIKNLVRPFTLNQIKELLSRTGKIVENGFWIDRIKSKCFVEYANEDQAFETRQALHGISWPLTNPKKLHVEYATKDDMQEARESSQDPPSLRKTEVTTSDTWQQGWTQDEKNNSNKVTVVREWDLGKEDGHVHLKDKEKDRKDDKKRRQRSVSPSAEAHLPPPARKFKKKEDEPPPAKLLDDLFKKTKATPCIYWLPLTSEQIAIKKEMRRQHMAEHARRLEEMRRVERNRDRDRDRRRRSPRK